MVSEARPCCVQAQVQVFSCANMLSSEELNAWRMRVLQKQRRVAGQPCFARLRFSMGSFAISERAFRVRTH